MSYFFTRDQGGLGLVGSKCVEVPDYTNVLGTGKVTVCPDKSDMTTYGIQLMLRELGLRFDPPNGRWDNDTELQMHSAAAQGGFSYPGGQPEPGVVQALIAARSKAIVLATPVKLPTASRTTPSKLWATAYGPPVVTGPPPGRGEPIPIPSICPEGQAFNISTGQCVAPQVPVGPPVCPAGQVWEAAVGMCVPEPQPSPTLELPPGATPGSCAAAGGTWDPTTLQCMPAGPTAEKPFPWLYVGLGLGGVAVLGGVFWYASSRKKATPNPRRRRAVRRHRRTR